MIIQFFAMLVHRFGTFSQVITKTHLDFDFCNKSIDEMTEDELKSRDPIKLVADLQKLKGINNEYEDQTEVPVEMRKTMSNLAKTSVSGENKPIFYLDEAFHRRVTKLDPNTVNSKQKNFFKKNFDKIFEFPDPSISDFRKKSIALVQRRMSKAAPNRLSQARPSVISFPNGGPTDNFLFDENPSDVEA